jgi:hypothetical protein
VLGAVGEEACCAAERCARTISRQVGLSYGQVKRAIIFLIKDGKIDRLSEVNDEDGVLIVYSMAIEAARLEEEIC